MDGGKRLAAEVEDDKEVAAPNNDSRLFEDILPKEMWEIIAKMVLKESTEDYLNLVNSSPFFQHLMASQRTTALFEQVLSLVAVSLWEKDGLEGFPVKDVLNCRLVCKQWNTAVQKVVPEKFDRAGKSYFGKGSESLEFYKIALAFEKIQENEFATGIWDDEEDGVEEEEDSAHRFLRHFEQTHPSTYQERNPFFCTQISLTIDDDLNVTAPAYQRYLQGVTLLLTKYGTRVEICFMEIFVVGGDQFLSLVPKWLSLLPNLKKFEFCDREREYRRQMEFNVDATPLPESKCLEKITIYSRAQPILKYLIKQSRQTVCELSVENPEEYEDLFTYDLPNLKKLTLFDCQRSIVEQLNSPHVQWRLEYLKLEEIKFIGGWARLFQVIQNKFAETLVSLKLDLVVGDDIDGSLWQDCENCRLDLPKLKNIQLDFRFMPLCLEFLLPMKKNLEKITASCAEELFLLNEQFSCTSDFVIQYAGFERRMLESNIWGIFSKLNEFKVRCYGVMRSWPQKWSYFRKDWMLKNESGEASEN